MRFTTAEFSNPGGHQPNEDSLAFQSEQDSGVWTIADGLGGHGHGDQASLAAVQKVLEITSHTFLLSTENVRNLYTKVNQEIFRLNGPRTTLVTAFIQGNNLLYANEGDSRFYLFRNGQMLRHTDDHNVAYLSCLSGKTRYEDLRFDADRSKILRAVGGSQESDAQIYAAEIIAPGDALLLCTDGFWEYVFETEMEIDLCKSTTPKRWIDLMLLRLIRRCREKNDNFSAIAVFIGS